VRVTNAGHQTLRVPEKIAEGGYKKSKHRYVFGRGGGLRRGGGTRTKTSFPLGGEPDSWNYKLGELWGCLDIGTLAVFRPVEKDQKRMGKELIRGVRKHGRPTKTKPGRKDREKRPPEGERNASRPQNPDKNLRS